MHWQRDSDNQKYVLDAGSYSQRAQCDNQDHEDQSVFHCSNKGDTAR